MFTQLFDAARLSADSQVDHLRKQLPRFGHSLVVDTRGSLWMFGGFSLTNGPLNDIRLFDMKNNSWMPVQYKYFNYWLVGQEVFQLMNKNFTRYHKDFSVLKP